MSALEPYVDLDRGHRALPESGRAVRRRCEPPRFVEATTKSDAYWEMPYGDASPGDLSRHQPLARVDREQPGGSWVVAADDQGWPTTTSRR